MNPHRAALRVAITAATVITADAGVTSTAPAAGERVHIATGGQASGPLTAVRVTIQGRARDADAGKQAA